MERRVAGVRVSMTETRITALARGMLSVTNGDQLYSFSKLYSGLGFLLVVVVAARAKVKAKSRPRRRARHRPPSSPRQKHTDADMPGVRDVRCAIVVVVVDGSK